MKQNKTIDIKKIYKFPSDIVYIRHKNVILAILPETASWIVLQNDKQVSFLDKLAAGTPLYNAIEHFDGEQADAISVVTQIEARHLESEFVKKNTYQNLQIYTTNKCNMRCPHCYMSAGQEFDDELNTHEILDLLSNFKTYGGQKVILSGGEISTRKDYKQIILQAHSLGLEVELLTNGVMITEKDVDDISSSLDRVQISIDGFSEESNARIRGKGNFNKALKTLDSFVQRGVYTEVAITPLPDTLLLQQINDYATFAEDLINKYGERINIKFTTGLFDGREFELSKEEKEDYERAMEEINKLLSNTDGKTNAFIMASRAKAVNDNCAYGFLTVAANGDVYPCARIPSLKPYANIRKDSFEQIMAKSNKLKEKSNINNLIPCRDCEIRYICGGGCRIEFFPDFVDPSILLEDIISAVRTCSQEYKNYFYDLMVQTNETIFV